MWAKAIAFLFHELGLLHYHDLKVGSEAGPDVGEGEADGFGVGVSGVFEGEADAILERKSYGGVGSFLGKTVADRQKGSGNAEENEDNICWSPVHAAKPHKIVKKWLKPQCQVLVNRKRTMNAGSASSGLFLNRWDQVCVLVWDEDSDLAQLVFNSIEAKLNCSEALVAHVSEFFDLILPFFKPEFDVLNSLVDFLKPVIHVQELPVDLFELRFEGNFNGIDIFLRKYHKVFDFCSHKFQPPLNCNQKNTCTVFLTNFCLNKS